MSNFENNSNDNNNFQDKLKELNNTTDRTNEFEKQDIEENKVMALLSYLSWLVIIPIAFSKSPYARFHANQGLVLIITEIAWAIFTGIVGRILFAISWRLSFLTPLLGLVNFVFLVLAIIGIVNAVTGKAKELPLIGKYKILK